MGSRYLLELADWCRQAGLRTIEDKGWEHRARASGGYEPDRPWCVMWHHTASHAPPKSDVDYICRGGPYPPIANLLLDRSGTVWVCAGGASNTNGKGGPLTVSRGVVPADQMNTYAVAIEAANDGLGEVWPAEQIDAYFAISNKLCDELGLLPTDLAHHSAWSPGRKIDCAKAVSVEGPWRPRSINSSSSWSTPDTQAEAAMRTVRPPDPPDPTPPLDPTRPPQPAPPEEDTMRVTTALDSNGTIWVGDGITRRALDDMEQFSNYVVLGSAGCYQFVNTSGQIVRELGHVAKVGQKTIEALGAEQPM